MQYLTIYDNLCENDRHIGKNQRFSQYPFLSDFFYAKFIKIKQIFGLRKLIDLFIKKLKHMNSFFRTLNLSKLNYVTFFLNKNCTTFNLKYECI